MILKERKIEQNTARDYNKKHQAYLRIFILHGKSAFPVIHCGFSGIIIHCIPPKQKLFVLILFYYSSIYKQKKTPEPN